MRILLDTHVLLWWLGASSRLSKRHAGLIESDTTEVLVSAATAWEIGIKKAIGKLTSPDDLPGALEASLIEPLEVTVEHGWAVEYLPNHHGDPFDRLLVAQAQIEGLTIATVDPVFSLYDVPTI